MTTPSVRELEEHYALMSPEDFSCLDRSSLMEDGQTAYDKEVLRRQTPEWLAQEARRQEEIVQHAEYEEMKRLYHRSRNIVAIAVLLILGVLTLILTMLFGERAILLRLWGTAEIPLLLLIVALYATAILGILLRTHWGRIMGLVVCGISLVNIPIGTIIGIVGLFAFAKGKRLFGSDRLKHADARREFKRLQQAVKTQKGGLISR